MLKYKDKHQNNRIIVYILKQLQGNKCNKKKERFEQKLGKKCIQ